MTVNLEKFRKSIIIFAIISFSSYPILEIVARIIDTRIGRNTSTNGAGILPYHVISEPAMYLFIYGLPTAVALSFIYVIVRLWNKKPAKGRTVFIAILGVIVTACSFMPLLLLLMLIGVAIDESFSVYSR
jgi:hypothetical protein